MTDGHGGHSHDGHDHGFAGGRGHALGLYDMPFSGHHAGQTTFDAIIVGHAFGTHGWGMPVDHSVDSSAHFHAASGSMEGNGPSFDGPSFDGPLDINRTNFGALVIGMGYIDYEKLLKDTAFKLGLAECLNLQLQPPITNRRFDEILPINYRPGPAPVTNPLPPKGAKAAAAGSTTIYRTNWQIGETSWLQAKLGIPPKRKLHGVRVNLEVELMVWHFSAPNDYEIRLVVRALGRTENQEMPELLAAARTLTKTMFEAFKKTPPSEVSLQWRREHAAA